MREGSVKSDKLKKQQDKIPDVFKFPVSREGLETSKSVQGIFKKLRSKWEEAFPGGEMRFPYIMGPRNETDKRKKEKEVVRIMCSFCTNMMIYERMRYLESDFRLKNLNWYHKHRENRTKELKVWESLSESERYRPQGSDHLPVTEDYDCQQFIGTEEQLQEIDAFIMELPKNLTITSMRKIVCQKFRISDYIFNKRFESIRSRFDLSLLGMISRFEESNYEYRYLPADLLEINRDYIRKKRQGQSAPDPSLRPKSIHDIDYRNPDLPNVLLIVTPQMKERYHRFGQFVGFDLTFSLIKEKPWLSEKQYLLGAFAGISQSRRIMIFGLVCTSTPSEEAYHYLFKQFIQIMGVAPPTFITDEEKSLYYAIRRLKAEGHYQGNHLFDWFHILKKIRKGVNDDNFQLIKKMLHTRDRMEYRRLLGQLMKGIKSDEELSMVRIVDLHSERFVLSQVDNSFVGLGISDGMNQKFHHFVKLQIPYQTTYMRVIGSTLEVIQRLNDRDKDVWFEACKVQSKLHFDILKTYRTKLSNRTYQLLMKQFYNSLSYEILFPKEEQERHNHMLCETRHEKSRQVDTGKGLFTVFWEGGKWNCYCEFQQKSGYPCSHICKVLVTEGKGLFDNIHKRWIIEKGETASYAKLFNGHKTGGMRTTIAPRRAALMGDHHNARRVMAQHKYETVPAAMHTWQGTHRLDFDSQSAMTVDQSRIEQIQEEEDSAEDINSQ